MGEAMDILKQCLSVLRLVFCAGWVHRDLSAGNILALRDGPNKKWQVKLSDLEYAKRFPSDDHCASPVPKTGTPYFMAIEIQQRKPLLPAVFSTNTTLAEDSGEDDESEGEEEEENTKASALQKFQRPVKHNYQHDLESIWWLFVWLGSARVKRALSRLFAKGLFQAGAPTGVNIQNPANARFVAFVSNLELDENFPLSLPEEMKPSFISGLETLRCDLYTAYTRRNVEGRQDDLETYSYIMSKAFHRFFRKIEKSRDKWEAIELKVDQDAGVEGQGDGEGDPSKKRKTMDEEEQEAEETDLQVGVVKKLTFASDTEKDDEENGTNEAIKLKDGRKKDSITLSPEEGNAGDGTKKSGKAGATAREHVATPAQTQRAAGPTTRSMTQAGGTGKEKPTAKAHGGTKKGNGDGPKPSKRARR
ncbi:other/FunK1 protein kinase [Coprinopsis cinerea okayama7|uniref:Other/FunK1 protein kinase n=1 Tax=Coprinopsis cinerea (strain Okayama-7 / 130 / ATCC MYA-4618 / FGSC 9003) TaxID=240176 RepID=A8NAZ8_COPC7|nr:other/FunK1 protein kinase [Coprinopsis cinerea okayama7\|eukprot:XP_001832000.1 other/FunK1 protein kinase [Coprinopsis cinerea okayama7\